MYKLMCIQLEVIAYYLIHHSRNPNLQQMPFSQKDLVKHLYHVEINITKITKSL